MIGRSRTVRYSRRAISRTEASAGSRRSGWTRSTGASVGVLLVIGRSRVVADLPGDELLLAQVELLAHGLPARGHGDDQLEDLLADLGKAGRPVDDPAAVQVHVLGHPLVHLGVGRELDRRRRPALPDRPAPGGEADDRGAPRDDPGDRHGVVAGGATVVCFTTGRGSVLGCRPTPSRKL